MKRQISKIRLSVWRIYLVAFFVFISAGIIFVRLYFLQVMAYEGYRSLSNDQHVLRKKLVPERGGIFLYDGTGQYPLAVNKETKMAYAVPREIENPAEASKFIAENLQLDLSETLNKLSKPNDEYEVIKHRLSKEEIGKISVGKHKGLYLSDESYRYYPSGELASHVSGFVGWKDDAIVGRYGIEEYFENQLRGEEGKVIQIRDTLGRWISTGKREIIEVKNGDTLVLTLDHIVQYETEKILRSAIEKFRADSGVIIVMEPETGRVISMTSYPNFDPNEYSKVEDIASYRNTAISAPYEPGSVFKAITLAAALDSEKIVPESTFVDTGEVREAGHVIKNSDEKTYGIQTMTNVLEKSLNTGAIYAQKLIGNRNFSEYVARFGFGDISGIDLAGESSGSTNNLKDIKRNINFFTASFGQGITVTPLQLALAYGAIANGGTLMNPQIIDKVINDSEVIEQKEAVEVRRVISRKASAEIIQMLRSVVEKGHGKMAGVPGYQVGGKTGTAQVGSTEVKGYDEIKTVGTFAGFAPIDNPRFVIVVKIDNPKDVIWAESSAAPTFGELMKFLLDRYRVEPTEEYTQQSLEKFNREHNLKEFFIKKEKEKDEENNIRQ